VVSVEWSAGFAVSERWNVFSSEQWMSRWSLSLSAAVLQQRQRLSYVQPSSMIHHVAHCRLDCQQSQDSPNARWVYGLRLFVGHLTTVIHRRRFRKNIGEGFVQFFTFPPLSCLLFPYFLPSLPSLPSLPLHFLVLRSSLIFPSRFLPLFAPSLPSSPLKQVP